MTDTTHEAPDLLPCPFCGGEARYYHRPDTTGWSNTDWVSCSGDCGASTRYPAGTASSSFFRFCDLAVSMMPKVTYFQRGGYYYPVEDRK